MPYYAKPKLATAKAVWLSASQYIETISCSSAVVVSVGAEPPENLISPSVPFANAAFVA